MLKKLVCIVMAVLFVLPVSAFAGSDVTSDGVKFYKEYPQTDAATLYREIHTAETGNVCVGTSVSNASSETKEVKVFFASYADAAKSELKAIAVESAKIPAGQTVEVKSNALMLNHNETVRAFVWADGVNPVVTPATVTEKTMRVFADFEDASHVVGNAPASNNSLPTRLASSNGVVVANDPEESAAKGKVLKYSTGSGSSVQFNGFLNANVGISSLPSYYTSAMEFDIFFPTAPTSTFYIDLNPNDGGGAMKNRLAITTSGTNARVVAYYGSSNKLAKDNYLPADGFWGKWHTVKVEYSSSADPSLAETTVYFDGIEISRIVGLFGTSTPSGNRFSISSVRSSGYDYNFYVDNVKLYA